MKSSRTTRGTLSSIALLLAASLPLRDQYLAAAEVPPAAPRPGWDAAELPQWPSPVAAQAVVVEGGTEIRWMPERFVFNRGASVRYIDFEGGDDARDGRTRETAWKRHPWDAEAQGHARAERGVHTYVFKGGVTYRGALVGAESGTAAEPIRLTRDPVWGDGPATISGADAIVGWRRLTDADTASGDPGTSGSPNRRLADAVRGRLWVAQVPGEFAPAALWTRSAAAKRERLTLARWPNWKVEHPYNIFTQWLRVEKTAQNFPRTDIFAPKVLNDPDPKAFSGATLWADHANISGEFSIIGPFPSGTGSYDPATGRLQATFTHPRRQPQPNAPFYLENMPGFLDEPGEWWFDAPSRKLYLWLPGDADPGAFTVEAARHRILLDLDSVQHVEVAGLTFTGGNAIDLANASRFTQPEPVWERPGNATQMAAIRLRNACRHIVLRHLAIEHSAGVGIANLVDREDVALADLTIADSRFESLDNDGIRLEHRSAPAGAPSAELRHVAILRNRMDDIGLRCSVEQGGRGIALSGVTVADIAGNVVSRTGGQGIDVVGSRMGRTVPLIRIQIRQNQVRDTLLQKTDFGGIEFWGVGPAYVYNNVSINPIGFVAHRNVYHKNECFYFDHGAKGYLFNNIGWSDSRDDAYKGIVGDAFFKEVRNRWNQAFANTSYNLRGHYAHEGAHGDQQQYLGNLAINAAGGFLSFWRLQDAAEIAFSHNVFAGTYENLYNRWQGDRFRTIEEARAAVAGLGNQLATDIGWVTDDSPVVAAAAHDFRLTGTSAAIDRGAKVFVPWSLHGTVGEWHFRLHPRDPATVLPYDVFPQTFHTDHGAFRGGLPENELKGDGVTAADYVDGPLENWVRGALRFDGARTLRLTHARLTQDFTIKRDKEEVLLPGRDRQTVRMGTNNLLVEAVFRAEPAAAAGTLAGKLGDAAGYAVGFDPQGRAVLRLRAGGRDASIATRDAVTDGAWHHLLVDVDRRGGKATLYLDGTDATNPASDVLLAADASLDNEADFVVGEGFRGDLDFLRVARGTLADAETTIGELMSWQFNGPHLHDFTGRAPTGGIRDAGALEHPTVSGEQRIRYTPPVSEAPKPAPAPQAFKTGEDRNVKALEWGSVSVPKRVAVGEVADIQVVFGTETIEGDQTLRVDLHGFVGRERVTNIARGAPVKVAPGVTTPYTVRIRIPERQGLVRATAVVYASRDGGWSTKTVSTEVGFAVGAGEGGASPTPPAAPVPAQPAAQPAQRAAAAAPGAEVPMQTKDFAWCTARWPQAARVGDTVPIEIAVKPGAIAQNAKLRVDTHWYEGRKRTPGGPRSRPVPVQANAAQTLNISLQVPDRPNISAVTYVVYVGPTGGWDDKQFVSELGMPVTSAGPEPVKAAGPEPVTTAGPKPAAGKPAPAPARLDGAVLTKVTDWCTLTITKEPKVGEEAVVTATLAPGLAITEPTLLTVDMHGWEGRKRMGSLGRFGQRKVKPGETGPFVFRKTVPDRPGIAAIAGVASLSPDGSWAKKTHSTEIGTRIGTGAKTAAPAGPAPAQPVASGGTGSARLFLLSGQSNMVGLNPNDTFVPQLKAAFPRDEIVVVKDAENGQPIRRWYRRGKRDLYDRLMAAVTAAAADKTFASVTFVWMQGEADATAEFSALYEESLKSLVQQLRDDLKRPDLTVVIGRISDCQKGQEHWDKIRAVQVAVADSDPLAGWIQTDDLNGTDNDTHYRDPRDRGELGRRLAAKAIELISKGQP